MSYICNLDMDITLDIYNSRIKVLPFVDNEWKMDHPSIITHFDVTME